MAAGCEVRPQGAGPKAADAGIVALPTGSIYQRAAYVRLFEEGSVETPGQGYRGVWLNPPGGYRLSADQVSRLRAAIVTEPMPTAFAACFIPHHFFRFYDAQDREVGKLAVCFCCSGVSAKPALGVRPDRNLTGNYAALKALVTELGGNPETDCEAS